MITTYINKLDILKWYIYKIQLIMRLTTVILMVSMLQVSASTFSPEFNYEKKGVSLIQILKEIKKQTSYNVVWNEKKIDVTTTMDANFKKANIHDVMAKALLGFPVTCIINNKIITIRAMERVSMDVLSDVEKNKLINVKGRVVDENGEPLQGAKISIKGTRISTLTDRNGFFYLYNVSESSLLTIEYIGYVIQNLKVTTDIGTIQMEVRENELKEIQINAGYYTVKEKEKTGSISRVDGDVIAKQPVNNVLGALIGRMPGVNIQQESGVNGSGYSVEIRGRNSLRGTSDAVSPIQPLYIVDGVPYPSSPIASFGSSAIGVTLSPLNYLNPTDIESVDILKDADATAIYGSRGANGVVLIKTKNAKEGKTSVDVSISSGISQVSKRIDMLNTDEYLEMRSEAFKNDGVMPTITDYDLNGTWDKNRYTDWQERLIGGTASSTLIQASVNGGNDLTQIVFRASYNQQTSVSPGEFSDRKGSGILAINHSSQNKKFKLNFSANFSKNINTLPIQDFTSSIYLPPNAPELYMNNGDLNWGLDANGASTFFNPIGYTKSSYNSNSSNFISSGMLSYEIFRNLSLRTSAGFSNFNVDERHLVPISSQQPSSFSNGYHYLTTNNLETWIIEPQLHYQTKFGKNEIDMLLGGTFQKDNTIGNTMTGARYTSDLLVGNITAAPFKNVRSSSALYKYNAIFARLNYNYDGRYLLNITGRRDGSSRFGPDKQFGNFGAVGAAWIFSEEKFIRELSNILSFGKLRVSYGITGSDQIPNYEYLETYSVLPYAYPDGSGLSPTRISNPDFSWEVNRKLDVAIDLGFLNDRILLSANWYRNRSSNQLVGYNLPDITGFTRLQYNLPATVENTGFEFLLKTVNISRTTFNWNTSLNLTIPNNRLISYPNILGSTYADTYTVGESLFKRRAYKFLGVNSEDGFYKLSDLDGNGVMEPADRKPSEKSVTSHFFAGLENSISFKNLTFDLFLQFVKKTIVNPLVYRLPGTIANQPDIILNRWRNVNELGHYQKFTQIYTPTSDILSSSDWLTDASFVRLKNVSISYSLPQVWTKKIKLNFLRVFLQGQNLFTLSDFFGDPEIGRIDVLPTLQTISIGIQASL